MGIVTWKAITNAWTPLFPLVTTIWVDTTFGTRYVISPSVLRKKNGGFHG
jgi:hypothetical protein